MPYEFFLSYARANHSEYVKKFLKDLCEAVRDLIPKPDESKIAFFDQQLELGEEWAPAIARALQTSKVMICLYSPAYFSSEYCGKEWHVFHKRRLLQATNSATTNLPPVIKPVIWVPFRTELPDVVAKTQYLSGSGTDAENVIGVKLMRSMHNRYSSRYKKYIQALAQDIVETGRKYPLAQLPDLPSLEDIGSIFAISPKVKRFSSAQMTGTNLNHVTFVFVAGAPEHFASTMRKQVEAYQQNGGREWRPFFPDQRKPIGPYVQYLAAGEELDFYSDELPFDPDLPNKIRSAEQERKLVVLLVDSWTAQLPQYKEILQQLDQLSYFNCSVLVPLNENDNETAGQLAQLKKGVRETFRRWSRNYKTIYFRDEIKSIDDLRDQLHDTLVQLQMDIINDPALDGSRPVHGDGPKIKPSL